MSAIVPNIDPALFQPAATSEAVLASALVDGSIGTKQNILTLTKETFITDVQIVRVSGPAVTLVTCGVGYNAAADDVVQLQLIAALGTLGLGMPLDLRDGFAVGQPGQTLGIRFGVTTVGTSQFRVTVFGSGG